MIVVMRLQRVCQVSRRNLFVMTRSGARHQHFTSCSHSSGQEINRLNGNLCLIHFLFRNVWKEGDDLSLFLFKFVFGMCQQEGVKYQEGLELNGTHQILVYADYVNALD